MPSKSQKQHKLMAMAAHDSKFAKEHGIDQSVAREFLAADKGKKISRLPVKVKGKKK